MKKKKRRGEKKKALSHFSSSSSFSPSSSPPHLYNSKTMSLPATLRKLATPSNVTSAAGWGATAAVGALFLVQVRPVGRFDFASLAAAARQPSPPFVSTSTSTSASLPKLVNKQPFDFIKRTLSGSTEEAK